MSACDDSPRAGPWQTRGEQPFLRLAALAGLSALLIFLSFPPVSLGPLAWVGLVPLIVALSQLRPAQGFFVAWLFGTLMMGGVNHFLGMFGLLPLLAVALFFGLFYALFGLVVAGLAPLRMVRLQVVAVAAAWTLVEMARGHAGPLAYTFGHLAYTQHSMLPILQFASLMGAYGVGFLIALTNAGLAVLLLAFLPDNWYHPPSSRPERNRAASRTMLAVYSLVFITYIWGALIIRGTPEPAPGIASLRAAAVQASASFSTPPKPDEITDAINTYVELSEELPGKFDLVVWPETAVGLDINAAPFIQNRIGKVAEELEAYMLVGALEWEDEKLYNSALLISPEGEYLDTYRKINLVIFGEYVPLRSDWKFLERYPLRGRDFSPGLERKIMDISGVKIGPIICFEAIFPGPGREVSRLGADVIVILNSDNWAEGSAELLHNSATAPLRAAEARRYIIRAASAGISAIYDPYGRPLSDVPTNMAGIAAADVYAREQLSTYHKWGDWPLLCICALALLAGLIKAHRAPQLQPVIKQ